MWPFSRTTAGGFRPKKTIIEHVRESNNFNPDEDLKSADAFILSDTTEERTWLVATKLRLYSITDNANKKTPSINWSISKSRIFSQGEFVLDIQKKPGTGESGLVDIGYRKGNPYTRPLFAQGDIEEKIKNLILAVMD